MAENVTLTNLSSLSNDGTAIAAINANNTIITEAFADCLALSGTSPNAMQANLDMNNFNIINLPSPSTIQSPVRVTDLNTFSGGGTITLNPLPVGGSQNAVLHKNSATDQDATWTLTPSGLTSIGATSSTVTTSNITGTAVLSGSSSGTTTVKASATASGTLTLPAATDTIIGKATTDTLTNKTYDTAGTGNVFKINGTSISAVTGSGSVVLATSPSITTPAISGVTDGSSAASGKVGEYQESVIPLASVTSLTTGATLNSNAKNLTSIALPAGDWDVAGNVTFVGTSSTALTCSIVGLSTTSATFDQTNGRTNITIQGTLNNINTATTANVNGIIGPLRFSSNGSQTVNLVVQGVFSASTLSAYGMMRARRVH